MISRIFSVLRHTQYLAKPVPPRLVYNSFLCESPAAINAFQYRNMSSDDVLNEPARNLDYNQLLEKKKEGKCVLIDVREHTEINETGALPGSVHIPLRELKTAFKDLTDEEFKHTYGIEKPKHDAQLIFSCRSGNRIGELKQALVEISPEEFEKKYSDVRPEKDVQVIFSCKAGGRSRKAMAQALEWGYTKAAHYKGGWLDWAANTKKS